jgi:hypothetical protein
LPAARVSSSSRRTSSEPKALPPGESTRSTMALILSSSRAFWISSAVERPPIAPEGSMPSLISPCAITTPTASPPSFGLRWPR